VSFVEFETYTISPKYKRYTKWMPSSNGEMFPIERQMPDASTQTDMPADTQTKQGKGLTRKPIAESTQKKYDQAIQRLRNAKIDLEKPEEFFAYAKDKHFGESAEKTYLSALKYELGKLDKPFFFPREYQDRIDELYKRQNKADEKQELKPKLLAKFVSYDKLLEEQKKWANKADKTTEDWVQYVITSLYTLNPPLRNDFGDMAITSRRSGTRTGNDLVWNKDPVIIMRNYKTHGTYGDVEVPVSAPLKQVLTSWFSHLGVIPPYVLGTKYSDTQTLRLIGQAFKGTGKSLGIDNLRHAYIQHFVVPIADNTLKRDAIAKRMLHSRDTQQNYISQNLEKKED